MTESLTVRDNRTGLEYDVPIGDGTVRAADLGKIRDGELVVATKLRPVEGRARER